MDLPQASGDGARCATGRGVRSGGRRLPWFAALSADGRREAAARVEQKRATGRTGARDRRRTDGDGGDSPRRGDGSTAHLRRVRLRLTVAGSMRGGGCAVRLSANRARLMFGGMVAVVRGLVGRRSPRSGTGRRWTVARQGENKRDRAKREKRKATIGEKLFTENCAAVNCHLELLPRSGNVYAVACSLSPIAKRLPKGRNG